MTDDPTELPDAADVDGDPIATIGQRVGARAIDWFILLVAAAMIGLIAVGGNPETVAGESNDALPTWAILLSVGIIFFYETLFVAVRGQTIGKAIVGIEIVSLATGKRPNIFDAAIRVVPIIAALVLLQQFAFVALVFVYFSAGFMAHQRGLLDRIARTVVIQGRRGGLFG